MPVDKVFPGLTAATLPDYFALEKESFFDSAVMHVIASGTLRHMAKLAAPGSVFDPRRFRPTIFVDTGERDDAFIEDEWLGGTLEVGDSVRIVAMRPALRCVMTTHPQEDLPRDYTILRTAAFHHRANVGVFASIGARGPGSRRRSGVPGSIIPLTTVVALWKQRRAASCEIRSAGKTIVLWRGIESRRVDAGFS